MRKQYAVQEIVSDPILDEILARSASRHKHLCPRQVLGARMGMAGGIALGISLPIQKKNLLVIAETDGCFISGLEVATGAAVHRRTMRIEDFGKIAATFVDVPSGNAVRIAPRPGIREAAWTYACPEETRRYYAMLAGYQRMPGEELFKIEQVFLRVPIQDLISRAGVRVNCAACGEEVINEREVYLAGKPYCLPCSDERVGFSRNLVEKRNLSPVSIV